MHTGGNLKNIYVYNNRHSGDYSVPLYQRKNKKKEKKNKRNEIYAWTVLHVIHITKKSQIRVIKINYRRLTT